ncbi:receptor like protein 1 [Striga asiatica]|uniref:Receptor like protein 1 n=1 Tax=Striga asiatica TaxID=4170 RepID=A0A5A7RE22_STRAF|nr:receptor like protein 1 [Striga asiatica]
MAENGSPRRIRWPADDYNQLATLEVDQERPRTPDSEFRQLYNQIHSTCHLINIDWDRICVLGLATISVMLIVITFFPFLQTQLKSVYHEHSVLSIFLDHELLWVTRTLDFFIDIGDNIAFNVSMNKITVSVPDSFVPTAFLESRALNKSLHFKLKYDGMMREGMAAWEEERAHLYVICGWIQVAFVDNTTLKGGPANCSIEN